MARVSLAKPSAEKPAKNATATRSASSERRGTLGAGLAGPRGGIGNQAMLRLQHRREEGRALDPGTRAYFEERLGHDLGHVRVHTSDAASAAAQDMGALAYTTAPDIGFRRGAYAPNTAAGRRVLGHELTHVVQQTLHPSAGSAWSSARRARDAGEVEADRAADLLSAGHAVPAIRAPAAPLALLDDGPSAESMSASLTSGMTLADRSATANMSTVELQRLEADLQGWLDAHPTSSFERRQIETTLDLVRASLLQRGTAPLLSSVGLTTAITASVGQGFVAGLRATTDAGELWRSTDEQLSTLVGRLKFQGGFFGGLVVGALKSLKDNVIGLIVLALAAGAVGALAAFGPLLPTVIAANPELRAKLEPIAASVLTALENFVLEVLSDPAFLTNKGYALGLVTGLDVGDSINAEYLAGGPFDKGLFVGELLGYAAMEIALLFIGPEELLLKGGRGAGRGAVLMAEKLSQRARMLVKGAPELLEAINSRLGKLTELFEPLVESLRPVLVGEGGPATKFGGLGGDTGKAAPKNEIQERFLNAMMEAKGGKTGGGAAKAEGKLAKKAGQSALPKLTKAETKIAKSAEKLGYRISFGEQPGAEIVAALQEEERHLLAVSVLGEDGEVVSFWISSASGKEAAAAGHTEIGALRVLKDSGLVSEGDLVFMQGRLRPCTGNCPHMGFCYKALDAIAKESTFDIAYETTALMNDAIESAYLTTIKTGSGKARVLKGPEWMEWSSAHYFEAGKGRIQPGAKFSDELGQMVGKSGKPKDAYGAGKPLSAEARNFLKKLGLLE